MNWVRTCADWTPTGSDCDLGNWIGWDVVSLRVSYLQKMALTCDPSDWFILHLIMIIWLPCLVFLWKYSAHESILALEHPRIMKAGPALFPLKVFQWRSGTFYSWITFQCHTCPSEVLFLVLGNYSKNFPCDKTTGNGSRFTEKHNHLSIFEN